MRRLLKFLHSLAAAGFTGAVAVLGVMMILAPASIGAGYIPLMVTMSKIGAWILGPSMVLTVVSGLASMAVHHPFQNAGWVWVKAATGLIVLLGGVHVLGPIQEEVKRNAGVLTATPDPASVASLVNAEANTLWLLLAVSAANIALGVWRPKMPQYPV